MARAVLQTPRIYFFDTGLVKGDEGIRFEIAVAAAMLKHVHYLQNTRGQDAGLHYIRTKDGAEIDFAVSDHGAISQLIECKQSDSHLHSALAGMAERFPQASAREVVRHLRQARVHGRVYIVKAADWLAQLAA